MATPYQTARGYVSSFADIMFRGDGKWASSAVSHLQVVKEGATEKDNPWIHNRLVWTTQERYWPITLAQFREVNAFLADHLPRVQKDDEWAAIAYFFKVVAQERRDEYMRLEEMEREAMETVRRCLGQ